MLDRGRAMGEDSDLIEEWAVVFDESLVDRPDVLRYFFDFHTPYSCHGSLLQDGSESAHAALMVDSSEKRTYKQRQPLCQAPVDSFSHLQRREDIDGFFPIRV
jgi:peptide methionine sulfoxide reductase MsrA